MHGNPSKRYPLHCSVRTSTLILLTISFLAECSYLLSLYNGRDSGDVTDVYQFRTLHRMKSRIFVIPACILLSETGTSSFFRHLVLMRIIPSGSMVYALSVFIRIMQSMLPALLNTCIMSGGHSPVRMMRVCASEIAPGSGDLPY